MTILQSDIFAYRDAINARDLSELTILDGDKLIRFSPEQVAEWRLPGLSNFALVEMRIWEKEGV